MSRQSAAKRKTQRFKLATQIETHQNDWYGILGSICYCYQNTYIFKSTASYQIIVSYIPCSIHTPFTIRTVGTMAKSMKARTLEPKGKHCLKDYYSYFSCLWLGCLSVNHISHKWYDIDLWAKWKKKKTDRETERKWVCESD